MITVGRVQADELAASNAFLEKTYTEAMSALQEMVEERRVVRTYLQSAKQ